MPTLQLEVALGYGWIEGLQEEEMIPFVMRAHSLGARGVALFARGGGTICPITYNITNKLSNYYAARSATPLCRRRYRGLLEICASGRQGQAKEDA